ncbi:MAG TPA: hypothetical protein V6D29_17035 [Leptolyngbyaceae cyanobacterium]
MEPVLHKGQLKTWNDGLVSVPPSKLRGVYVVEKAKLVVLLKSLG